MNERALAVGRALARTDGWVSGARLGRETGVSRVTVRKYVRRLQDAGALVDARAGIGYRMRRPPERPDEIGVALCRRREALEGEARPVRLGAVVEHHAAVGSTNDLVVARAREGAAEGLVVTADVQTEGRGRRGRRWESPPGGLYMSFLLRPPIPPSGLNTLGLLVALALCRALDALGIEGASIKWPNDVMIGGGKLAGVLVEAAVDVEAVLWVVVGVGANVARVPQGAPASASNLDDAAPGVSAEDPRVSRAAVAGALLDELEALLAGLYGRVDAGAALVDQVAARCATLGADVSVSGVDGSVLSGRAVGLAPDGSLLVESGDRTRAVTAGDVTALGGPT